MIDVLAPEGLGRRADLTTTPPGRTIQVPGGTQALARTELLPVTHEGVQGHIPRPSLLGAIICKAAAVPVHRDRQIQLGDLALLLSLVADPPALAPQLSHKDRARLRAVAEIASPDHAVWGDLAALEAARARLTLRTLLPAPAWPSIPPPPPPPTVAPLPRQPQRWTTSTSSAPAAGCAPVIHNARRRAHRERRSTRHRATPPQVVSRRAPRDRSSEYRDSPISCSPNAGRTSGQGPAEPHSTLSTASGICPVAANRIARWRPGALSAVQQAQRGTPFWRLLASSRTLSPPRTVTSRQAASYLPAVHCRGAGACSHHRSPHSHPESNSVSQLAQRNRVQWIAWSTKK